MLYRICTEDKNRAQVMHLADTYFPEGFTLLESTGIWHGAAELALVLEVVTDDLDAVTALAQDIRRVNEQEAVLIQAVPVSSVLITADTTDLPIFMPERPAASIANHREAISDVAA
jgi:hypothetical protein